MHIVPTISIINVLNLSLVIYYRLERTEEVDEDRYVNMTTEKLAKAATWCNSSNSNSMKRYPTTSMVHGATNPDILRSCLNNATKMKRRSADLTEPTAGSSNSPGAVKIKHSPSLDIHNRKKSLDEEATTTRPSSADPCTATADFPLTNHHRSMSSVSLPEAIRERGVTNGEYAYDSCTGTPTSDKGRHVIDNSDTSSEASDTQSFKKKKLLSFTKFKNKFKKS